jgi:hypothetical protein
VPEIPKTKDDLRPAWLSSVLNRTVTGFETQFLEGGVLSDAYKLTGIAYAGGGADAPVSLVIKIANQNKDLRDFGMLANAYNKELRLYRDLSAAFAGAGAQIVRLRDRRQRGGRVLLHSDGRSHRAFEGVRPGG